MNGWKNIDYQKIKKPENLDYSIMIKIFEEFKNNSFTILLGELLDAFNDETYKKIIGTSDKDYRIFLHKIFVNHNIKFSCCGTSDSKGFTARCKVIHDDICRYISVDKDGSADVIINNESGFHHIDNDTIVEITPTVDNPIDEEIMNILISIDAKKFGL